MIGKETNVDVYVVIYEVFSVRYFVSCQYAQGENLIIQKNSVLQLISGDEVYRVTLLSMSDCHFL